LNKEKQKTSRTTDNVTFNRICVMIQINHYFELYTTMMRKVIKGYTANNPDVNQFLCTLFTSFYAHYFHLFCYSVQPH